MSKKEEQHNNRISKKEEYTDYSSHYNKSFIEDFFAKYNHITKLMIKYLREMYKRFGINCCTGVIAQQGQQRRELLDHAAVVLQL